MVWLYLVTATAFANDVLVPNLRAEDATSRVGAEIVYASMVEALADRNISFLDADDMRRFLGPKGEGCVQRESCPNDIWPDIKGTIAVLGTVRMVGEDVSASIEFHRRGITVPIEFFQADFSAKQAGYFAVDAALIVEDLLKMSEEDLAALGLGAAGLSAAALAVDSATGPQNETGTPEDAFGAVYADPNPEPEPEPEPTYAGGESVAQQPVDGTSMSMSEDEERKHMGLPDSLYQQFKRSGLSREEFVANERFRAKTFFVEFAPGLVFGDIQRRYMAIAQVVQGSPEAYYERDQFLPGTAFSLTAGAGYAPTWWLEVGLNLGIEFPQKDFVSGYEQYANRGEDWASGHHCPEHCDLIAFKPATALTLVFEPRIRIILVPNGLTKPYFVYGWATRFYDGYDTPDFSNVAYPNRSGAQTFGPIAGAGARFDATQKASAFVEMAYTHHLGPGIFESGANAIQVKPRTEDGLGGLITVRAGFVSRF